MSDETNFEATEGQEIDLDDLELMESEQTMDVIQDTMDTFLETANVDAVYGEPIENGETVVIPSAEVLAIMGFGMGSGYGSSSEEGEENQGGGSGGGGGGRVLARPVAAIISSPEGVRVEPIVDVTKIALAGLTAGGFMLGMILRMMSPKKAVGKIKT